MVTLSSFFYSSIELDSVIAKVLMDAFFFNNELVLIPVNQDINKSVFFYSNCWVGEVPYNPDCFLFL